MSELVETPFTPEDFREIAKIKDANIIRGISVGIEIEVQSRHFYQTVSHNLSPDSQILLKFLANEELEHLKTLLAFKKALEKTGNWIELSRKELQKIRTPRLYEGKGAPPLIQVDAKNTDIILAAMRGEKRAELFYIGIQNKMKEVDLKNFFNYLAKFERKHYDLLQSLLSN